MEALKEEFMFAVKAWEIRKPVAKSASRQSSVQPGGSEKDKRDIIRLDSLTSAKSNGFNQN